MTVLIKIFCDKCGKEAEEGERLNVKIGSISGVGRGKIYKDGDLCEPCAIEAVKFIFPMDK